MTDANLAPNLPDWMVEHANRYLSSGGADGHMYKMTPPGRPEMAVPSLLLTTTGRKSGEKFIFPLFYGRAGDSYIVVASKGGAPQHPGWYRNILANPEVDLQVGLQRSRRGPGPPRARSARGCGKRRWSSGRPTPITRARPSARSRWSCWTLSADIGGTAPSSQQRHPGPRIRAGADLPRSGSPARRGTPFDCTSLTSVAALSRSFACFAEIMMSTRLNVLGIAAALAVGMSSAAMAQYAPCPAGYALYGGVCQPVPAPAPAPAYPPAPAPAYPSNPVSGAAAGGAAGAAAGESTGGPVGAVVGGALGTAGGALSGTANMLSGGSAPPPAPACGPGFVYYNGACYPR